MTQQSDAPRLSSYAKDISTSNRWIEFSCLAFRPVVSQYNLKYAVADANSFAEEIRRQQAQLARFPNVDVNPLLNDQATKTNILAALQRQISFWLTLSPLRGSE